MRIEPDWLTDILIKTLHAHVLKLFGGSPGIRDEGLLQGAITRPVNLWLYDESSTIFELAAAYGFGLAKNHAFIDGNKRIALLAIRAFLFRNGYRFEPDEIETVIFMEGIASGAVSEAALADWIEANCTS